MRCGLGTAPRPTPNANPRTTAFWRDFHVSKHQDALQLRAPGQPGRDCRRLASFLRALARLQTCHLAHQAPARGILVLKENQHELHAFSFVQLSARAVRGAASPRTTSDEAAIRQAASSFSHDRRNSGRVNSLAGTAPATRGGVLQPRRAFAAPPCPEAIIAPVRGFAHHRSGAGCNPAVTGRK